MELHRLVNGEKVEITEIQKSEIHSDVWSKENYCILITKQIQSIIDSQAQELDYDDIKDVPTENFEGGVYQQEAVSLLTWASNLWLLRDAYFNRVNSEQDIDNNFINSLPKFNH